MKKNVGEKDKQIRIGLGIFFAIAAVLSSGILPLFLAIASFLMFFTGLTNSCFLYSLFGINTCKVKKK